MVDFADAFGEETVEWVNPAIAAKERIRKILEQQAEDVLNGTSSVKLKEKKKPSTSKKADYNKATYNHYKSLGYWVYRVDYFDHRLSRQHDFLGFADMMALGKGEQILIQLTSKANMGERKKKILALPSHRHWLKSGGQIHVIGWEKLANGRLQQTTIRIGANDETKHSKTTGADVPC
ncbi:MAG: hypothetical protein ACK5S6_03015 [bacterium]